MLQTLLLIVLVLWLFGFFGYGRTRWGFGPTGDVVSAIVVLVVIYLVLRLLGVA